MHYKGAHILKYILQTTLNIKTYTFHMELKYQDLQGKKGPSKATANFCKFFTKRIYTPYPDYGARILLWRGLLERHGAILTHHFNISTLAYLSPNYSIGDIEDICKTVLDVRRLRKVKDKV